MLKSTAPATATTADKAPSACLKIVNNVASIHVTNLKNPPLLKPGQTNQSKITLMMPSSKGGTCSTSGKSATTPPCKNTNCTKATQNGETTSSAFSIPVAPKSQQQPPPATQKVAQSSAAASCVKATNTTANQTTITHNSTNCANNSAASTTNGTSIPAPPPPKVENTELRIIIIDENWSQYCYRIKINTPFGKLINRFCQQVRKIDHKSVLFWYHGRLVEDDDTPKTLNIKDGEVILAHYIK